MWLKLDHHIIENLETNYRDKKILRYKNFTFNYLKTDQYNLLLPNNQLIENLKNIINKAAFNIIQSSLCIKHTTIYIGFLTSAIN